MPKIKTFRLPDEIIQATESWLDEYKSHDYPKVTWSDIVRLSLHEFLDKYKPTSSDLPFLKFHGVLSPDELAKMEQEEAEEYEKIKQAREASHD